jgi:hypothetical protein
VENDSIENLSIRYSPRFGKIAVDMRFVTAEQLTEALAEQAEDSLNNRPHRFIGYILSEKGWITNEQVDIVIDIFFKAPVLEYQPFLNSLLKLA